MAQPQTGSPEIHELKRGDIWYVRLSGSTASETWQLTPCVVIQADEINQSGSFETVIVVPLTTRVPEVENQSLMDIILSSRHTGLPKDTMAVWSLVRSVRPARFLNKTGHVESRDVDRISRYIYVLMGMK